MKDITIRLRISEDMREKLDEDRGSLTISEYIRGLIRGEDVATKSVATKEDIPVDVATEEDVMTEEREFLRPMFKDEKLNKKVYGS